MTAYKPEEFSVIRVADELFKKARFRSHIAEKCATRLRVLREASRVTLHIARALFVPDRSLRQQQEHLLGDVDQDV